MATLPTDIRPETQACVVAAVDVGSNSVRLVVAEARSDGSYRVLDDEKETTRLGAGLNETGLLQPSTMELSAGAIARMVKIAQGLKAERVRIVATSAVRVADNGEAFAQRIEERTGVPLEILSGDTEAKLAFLSVQQAFELEHINCAVVDIGGGSVEAVCAAGGVMQHVVSVDTGAVRLTERFGPCEGGPGDGYLRMRRHIRRILKTHFDELPFVPHVMFGTGGTFTALAAMELERKGVATGGGPPPVRGYELQRSGVKHALDRLRKMTVDQRRRVPGISAERAQIVVAGLCLLEMIVKHMGVNSIRVHDRGIRDGLVIEMMRERWPWLAGQTPPSEDRMDAARMFGERCRYERGHVEHVAALALELFDACAREPAFAGSWADPPARDLLHAAALLHDVGYFVNYSKHHKHSYHLIVHSELPGYSGRELEIIANVARYHRRAEPRAKHAPFAALPENDRDLVRRLGGILRIAVGLDRTHASEVRRVGLEQRGGRCVLLTYSDGEPLAELWGADKKKGLFERAFGVELLVEHAPGPAPPQEEIGPGLFHPQPSTTQENPS